ncbi:MAG: cysteine-rich CWC family protein [Pseudolabrys sp.]
MTAPLEPRRLACARCGAAFDCRLEGGCWCNDEAFRLPLPTAAAEDCLCPTCLRALAAEQSSRAATPR